ncbi:hypothetical protein PsorP6_006425 [Peronosclerospora sorghi]|uniref:Uncharacterized protein n=1 Tax=Peronosclerospora sorghi TaxID=230839 RepID=A0ACC0W6U3_9STRA|nr:hypothetical protein PsorP6_006425 [Peronosclerospora sorghi]
MYGLRENARRTIVLETGDGVLHTTVHAGDDDADGNRRNKHDTDRRENSPIRSTVNGGPNYTHDGMDGNSVRFQRSNNILDAESDHSTQSSIRRSHDELERRDDQVDIFDEEKRYESPPHRNITSTLTEPLDSENYIILTQDHPDDLLLRHPRHDHRVPAHPGPESVSANLMDLSSYWWRRKEFLQGDLLSTERGCNGSNNWDANRQRKLQR